MTKTKRILTALLIAAVTLGAFWLYWEKPMTLASLLPDAAWTKAHIFKTDFSRGARELDCGEISAEELLSLLEKTQVDRRERDPYLNDTYFQIRLYREDGFPSYLYVQNNGRISLAIDLPDGYRYYEHGEELFQILWEMGEQ